jgi:hypothetical protein
MANFLANLYNQYIRQRVSDVFEDNKPPIVPDTSTGLTQEQIDQYYSNPSEINNTYVNFNTIFEGKRQRIAFYRDMSNFPEISDSLDYICDESVVQNMEGDFLEIEFDSSVPKNVQKRIRRQFDYLCSEIFQNEDKLWEMYRKWLVDGEMYLEIVLTPTGKSIQAIKLLPSYTMVPKYDGDKIVGYEQYIANSDALKSGSGYVHSSIAEPDRKFDSNQILYVNYGKYGKNNLDILGYLDSSIRPYNQLKNMEDSLVVYRLTRATERRVFNIAVGKMQKGKAEQYIQNLINKHKNKTGYDSATGALQTSRNIMALTEDFWFAKDETGKGTEVSNLAGGMNIGEISDVEYFLKKLYKTLKLPPSRWQNTPQYTSTTEIGRDEIKFANFVKRLQTKFKKIFTESLLFQMRIQDFEKRWIDPDLFNIRMIPATYLQKDKELDMRKKQLESIQTVAEYIISEGNDKGMFAFEFAMKKFVGLTDDDFALNDKMIEIQQLKAKIEKDNVEKIKGTESPEENVGDNPEEVTDINPETGKPIAKKDSEKAPEETPEEPVKEESVKYPTKKKSIKDKLSNLDRYKKNFKILNSVDAYMTDSDNSNLNTIGEIL